MMTPNQSLQSRESALNECERLIMHFDERAKGHKRQFVRYKHASVGLTVGVTVITALQGIYQPAFVLGVDFAVISGLAAFCTTMVHATNSQELWLRSRSMTQLLTTERFLFLQGAGAYSELEEARSMKLFSCRLMEIWAGGQEQWEVAVRHQKGA
jgi:hypothetical protein